MHKLGGILAAPTAAIIGWSAGRVTWLAQQAPPTPQSVSEWVFTFGVATPTMVAVYWMLRRSDGREETAEQRASDERRALLEQLAQKDHTIRELAAQVAALRARLDDDE